MMKRTHLKPLFLVPVFALMVSALPPGDDDDDDKKELELDEAEVFIEFNSTDGDFGIQFFWDGEPWDRMHCEGPDERKVLNVRARRNLADQGLTEGFFESAEPSTKKLSMEEFLERFPEGEYEFEGLTLEGDEIEGETEFTHTLPSPPANLYPPEGDRVRAKSTLVVSFDAVTTDLDGNPLTPELYEIVLETETEILRVLSMTVEGDTPFPSMTVPPEFLEAGLEYKLEIIVQEESGNRTISETTFMAL